MTSPMLKQSENLKLLHKCSPLQRKVLLKSANPALVHAICDCITNIIHQRIPITAQQKGVLAKKKNVLRTLANSRTKTSKKRKPSIQHGGDILKTILGSVERPYIIMSITPGKKFLVIPSDMYDRLTKHTVKSYQPEKSELIKSEKEMQSVWDSSVPAHEKVKLCTEELNKSKSLLKTMAEPPKVKIQQQDVQ